ncbi:hypothetical protein [uncultured Sulfitobacter sp.]|uniref:hypothetical protein n=1 Tax=uncultured Sulfitobacter sp. TaxID=191468 RepID=UPI00260D16B6|nr:hypothetical protein [uncultured Sulfitobacter sp.]
MKEEFFLQHPFFTHALSLLLGAISSYVVWWFLNHKWLPVVRFGEEICRYSVGKEQALYVCAFENSGRRNMVDVEVITRIGIKKFNNSESWIYFSVKSNASQVPVIEPGRRALVRIFDERQPPAYIDEPPPSLRVKLDSCRTLEDIFMLSAAVEIRLHVFGYDSFSGVRHHFESPSYSQNDIRSGRLNGLVVVKA